MPIGENEAEEHDADGERFIDQDLGPELIDAGEKGIARPKGRATARVCTTPLQRRRKTGDTRRPMRHGAHTLPRARAGGRSMSFFKQKLAQLPRRAEGAAITAFQLSRRVGSEVAMATVDQSSMRGLATA
jgi:hypothetical protein